MAFGKPAGKASGGNVSLAYRFTSEIPPIRPLRLKIEINTREHFTVLGSQESSIHARQPMVQRHCGRKNLRT